ncbi:MAG: endonuclease/exonuclease/phosphatase family protein [Phycisphaerales bacterium]|nr:endonuclease/exonuclease/phosphatase family protein [Phycisphaerales bacterium]
MNTTHNQLFQCLIVAALTTPVLCSTGCKNSQSFVEIENEDQQPTHETTVLDGNFDDWDGINSAKADGRYIYLNFSPKSDKPQPIQAAPYSTRIRFDVDQDPQTGHPMGWMSFTADIQQPQGVDLLIELSPKNELGSIGIGSSVTLYQDKQDAKQLGHADLGFFFLPTYASTQYEARIDRLAPGAQLLRKQGLITMVIDQVDENERFLWSTTIQIELPAIEENTPSVQSATVPTKPADSVRVMSSNVLFSSPLEEPESFQRAMNAIDPDVILYQEWFNTPADQVQGWLNSNAGHGWQVHMPSAKAGVAIATRNKILKTYASILPASGNNRPARAVAALIDTDAGELLAISIHLKCCGSAGSEEDNKRVDQAKEINAFVRSVHTKHPNAKVVIAGDFNLVGSYLPMATMVDSLGVDGRDLTPVPAKLIGDDSMVTWIDEKSRFSPGRLDWMLIDESMSAAQNAFVLDTRAIPEKTLQSLGLHSNDSKASDHLPIVIDLVDAE